MPKYKKNKIITVIIPIYNRTINIKLLKNLCYFKKKIEIFFIDDGSNKLILNKNKNILKNFKFVKYFKLNKNFGQSYACNYGLKKTKTKYVWFFDDDDYIKSSSLKLIFKKLKKDADGYILPMVQIYKNVKIKEIYPQNKSHSFDNLKANGQQVSTSCCIFKFSQIKKIKGWDEKLFGGTDTDLFLRFSKNTNFSILKCMPVIINLSQSNRLTNMVLRQTKAKIYFLRKHWAILTFKRKIYYILTIILFAPVFYPLKNKIIYFLKK